MLSNQDLERRFVQSTLTEAGRQLVRKAREQGPARDVKFRYSGVRTSVVSQKTGLQVLTESRKVELSALVTYEHDSDVDEVWAQPFQYDITVTDKNGRARRATITPDFLLVKGAEFVIDEWREDERLERLAKERPKDFGKDANGVWHFYPAEEALGNLGFVYRLRSSSELPQKRVSNLMFLRDLVSEDAAKVTDEELRRLKSRFDQRGAIPFLQLLYEDGFTASDLYQAIAREEVFVDLTEVRLDQTDTLIVYRDRLAHEAAKALAALPKLQPPGSLVELRVGTRIAYEGRAFRVALAGSETVTLVDDKGEHSQVSVALVRQLFAEQKLSVVSAPRSDAAELDLGDFARAAGVEVAFARLKALQNPSSAPVSKRTLRRWRALRDRATSAQDALRKLMPKVRVPSRLSSSHVYDVATRVANEFYNKASSPTRNAAYGEFRLACDREQLFPVARSTFYRWLDELEDTLKREGKRAVNAKAPIRQLNTDDPPRHGTHRHNVLYIDHTNLSQRVAGRYVADLGRPWLTLGVDGTGEPMAIYIDFAVPSTQSVFMLLRDYVRRHGRLPDIIVLDNGREFHSAALSRFCQLFNVSIRWRRASMPRDSTVVERLFGTTETEILAQLDGNTRAMKDPRSVSPSHRPEKHVRWTLPALYAAFEYFLFDVYILRIHPRWGITLAELRERQRVELGDRSHVFVRYDEVFRLLTSVHPQRKPYRRVDYQRGVYVNGILYWHPKLAKARPSEEVEVRVEMWRARVMYVNFRGEWLVAEARDGGRLEGRFLAEYEVSLRAEEQAKRRESQKDGQSLRVAQQKSTLWVPELWDERLREQCVEMHLVYAAKGMGVALKDAVNPRAADVVLGPQGRADAELIDELPADTKSIPAEAAAQAIPGAGEVDGSDEEFEYC